nr:RecE family exodeoxyribonuclease [Salmonella enterica]
MSGLLPYFVNLRAKVKSGLKDVVFWISAKSDARALREMENALEDADIKRSAFFKDAVITGLPVYNDLPQEGELDFTWCERYAFSDDTGTWLPIAHAQPEPAASDNASISEGDTDENATDNADSGDTTCTTSAASADTGAATAAANSDSATDTAGSANTAADTSDEVAGSEIATDIAHSCDVNVSGEPMTEVAKGMDWPMKDLPLPVRWMAQKGMDSKVLFLKPAERERLTGIMEADENHSQHLTNIKAITTGEMAPEIEKLTTYHLHRLVTAFDKVSEKVERMGPSMSGRFVRAWLDTEYIDQGILVNEWCAGRHVSHIEKPKAASVSEVPVTQKTPAIEVTVTARPHRSEKPTHRTINYELACGFYEDLDLNNLRPAMDFAKRIIAEDREDWKRMSMTVGIIPDIKGYDRQTIIDLVRKAPAAVHSGSPELRRTWCESFLAVHGVRDPDWYEHTPDNAPTTHEENSARIRKAGKSLRDIKEGRFNDVEEKPQPAAVLADEPAASETVEQDTTEHHPDPQPLENEPPVSQTEAGYQKIRAELHVVRKNIPPKNPVDVGKQLAAARGEYVEGISDPNDPKWVHNDYSASASNKGEKTENEDADEVNQNDDTVIQNTDSVNHSEPSAGQIEPEVPETEPKSLQPEPVTKVADGVFDVSAFFADTSNWGVKTEVTPPNNDDRSHEGAEEKATDAPATMESLLHEIVRLQSINNQLLEACAAYQERAETRHERFLEALFCGITRFAYQWVEGEEELEFEEKLRGDS